MLPSPPITTLHRLRLETGLSRYRVTRLVQINRKTLKRLEEGVGEPRTATVKRLADFYGVRPEWLLGEYRRDRFEADHERVSRAAAA
jgi:transcriptional regulator with XRE-family HTH domain